MNVPPPAALHLFSVEDYHRMGEADVFSSDARIELLDGQIFDMLPIGPFHASTVDRLVNSFARRGGERWIVRGQNPVRLNDRSEPQPDFALLRFREDFYARTHPVPADVFLLVEVADSTLRFDRERKLPAYARAGIVEFWLIDLVKRMIEVYREPSAQAGTYGAATRLRPGEQIAPALFPDMTFSVAELLSVRA